MAGLAIFSTHPLHPLVTSELTAIGLYRTASAPTAAAIAAEIGDADIVVVRAPIPPEAVVAAPRLRALIRHGAGLDMIPVEVATDAGVLVANVPGANAGTVAEHVIWSALALLRLYPQVDRDLRARGWSAGRAHSDHGREMSGRTLGIVGMGNVGSALARMAMAGFGMTVLCHTGRTAGLPGRVKRLPLPELLAQADIVALCCPLTPATRGMIDAAALARMRPGAILVNVARGPVVVESALIAALSTGALGGAALDVFDTQPLPPDHPFMALPNVILTPHMAGITQESMLRMGQGVVADVRRIADGGIPDQLVNPAVLPKYRQRFGQSTPPRP